MKTYLDYKGLQYEALRFRGTVMNFPDSPSINEVYRVNGQLYLCIAVSPTIQWEAFSKASGIRYDAVKDSLAEGMDSTTLELSEAVGHRSHAEGIASYASGEASHAGGLYTIASGDYSHAEGGGDRSPFEGTYTITENSTTITANGTLDSAIENYMFVVWKGQARVIVSVDINNNSFVVDKSFDGSSVSAQLSRQNVGVAYGNYSHAEGASRTKGVYSHAEGVGTTASGENSHAEGNLTTASGISSHAEGQGLSSVEIKSFVCSVIGADEQSAIKNVTGITFTYCDRSGNIPIEYGSQGYIYSDSECTNLVSKITVCRVYLGNSYSGNYFNVESGSLTDGTTYYWKRVCGSSGDYSHAEGSNATASGDHSHAEGVNTTASGDHSHAEGINTVASNQGAHAEGGYTVASGVNSHAEGQGTAASGIGSHAEGSLTVASSSDSHAEGHSTTASGDYSHAEGAGTTASGENSHAEGSNTHASNPAEHAEGKYNISNQNIPAKIRDILSTSDPHPTTNTIHSIGIGDVNNEKNAVEVMDSGDVYIKDVGGYDGTNPAASDTLQNTLSSMQDDINSSVKSSFITNIWKGTQSEYDAIVAKDNNTLYIIV